MYIDATRQRNSEIKHWPTYFDDPGLNYQCGNTDVSRTNKGEKGPGYEYWSRRHPDYFLDPGKYSKRLTKRYERREATEDIRRSLEDEDTESGDN